MSTFWFLAGVIAGGASVLIAQPLVRDASWWKSSRPALIAICGGAIVAFSAVALIVHSMHGNLEPEEPPPVLDSHPDVGSSGSDAGSMESAVARIEARVAREGARRGDWELLARAYDFLSRSTDAQRARENASRAGTGMTTATPAVEAEVSTHETSMAPAVETVVSKHETSMASASLPTSAASLPTPSASSASTTSYEARVRAKPDDAGAWSTLATLYRQQRQLTKAANAFAKLESLNAMDADSWADYADVLASAGGGSLQGKPAHAVDRALALNGRHPKALWLKASLAHEQKRYSDALAIWKQLRAVLPPGSSDVRIVDANISEATQLAGPQALATGIGGSIPIDRKLATRLLSQEAQ